ncbi:hypothetical protein AB0L75_27705 [Streptomyces sp. NPDC052101]|uniref:hypothetical protein n=1 Tax=Streptomyces sp. NPDC052101 TaxID=3155763 RepID=UPI003448BCAD
MTTHAVELRHYGHDDLPGIRQTLLDVHAEAYADDMACHTGNLPLSLLETSRYSFRYGN